MVSIGRSSLALFSLCRPTFAFLATHSSPSSKILHRTFAATATGLATAASLALLPKSVWAATTTTCDSSSPTSKLSMSSLSTGYLNSADAAALDVELMSAPGFSLEQLMELAGLAVAEAVYQVVPLESKSRPTILLLCGPGNNGGDGLVAARHLVFFGYDCTVVYPKRSTKTQHFVNLVQQCEDVGIHVLDEMPPFDELTKYSAMVDAIFGFSFKGAPREPFATALTQMMQAQETSGIPVISVDVPSGWNVDQGDVAETGFLPQVLVSLTTPKESARDFAGRHFVGGRFLPPKLAEKYKVQMPPYPGVSQVMEVTDLAKNAAKDESSKTTAGWEAEYAAYLDEKAAAEAAALSSSSLPLKDNEKEEKQVVQESWEAQYAAHCSEKEARLAQEDSQRIQQMKRQHEQQQ